MELTYQCPHCEAVGSASAVETLSAIRCTRCEAVRALHAGAIENGALRSCPWCATDDLYLQKDFPQALGLTIVVVGFVVSTIFWYYEKPLITYAVLLTSALVDMWLYHRVPDVTICYRCLGQFRGSGSNPAGRFQPFDLAIGERYRQERIRVAQLKQEQVSAPSPVPPSRAEPPS